jgi:hypothetical protein
VRAWEPLSPWSGGVCLLASCLMRDPIERVVDNAALAGSAWEPPSLDGSGHVFLRPGLGWWHRPGESQGLGSGSSSIASLRPE